MLGPGKFSDELGEGHTGNVGLQYVHVHAPNGVLEPRSVWISWKRQRTVRRNNTNPRPFDRGLVLELLTAIRVR